MACKSAHYWHETVRNHNEALLEYSLTSSSIISAVGQERQNLHPRSRLQQPPSERYVLPRRNDTHHQA